ncbi:punA [Symbiodinium sp. CCMP2456]|nr:punA [Symbiodinium sp. CCMP2456]
MYEGYSLKQITLPVRVMKAMGAELLLCSNASGGMNPFYKCGDIVLIDDHINLMGDNPLIGINDDRLGPRFPDMCAPYDHQLIDRALEIARKEDIVAHRGVFVAVAGPNLETRAEYRFLRAIGADLVGMSTVPEVIVAVHCGLRTVGMSIVTDMCLPDALKPADVSEIISIANKAEPKLRTLVKGVLTEFVEEVAAAIRRRWNERYSLETITLPVRVMKALGASILVVSNASGGMNPFYKSGDIMLMEDHINFMWSNPLTGHADPNLGKRFPDMSSPYDRGLIDTAARIARREGITHHRGVYAAMTGPNYETRSEYRFLKKIGADVVGMSTIPEAIVASQVGLRVLALSTVTNICLPDNLGSVGKYDVIHAAQAAEPRLRYIVREVLLEEQGQLASVS